MDCIVHGVTNSRTRLSDFHFHLRNFTLYVIRWDWSTSSLKDSSRLAEGISTYALQVDTLPTELSGKPYIYIYIYIYIYYSHTHIYIYLYFSSIK